MKKIFTLIFIIHAVTTYAQTYEWIAQESGVDKSLNDVFFTDSDKGWVVGNDGIILHTTNGGENWVQQTSGTTERLRTLQFINADTGWVAGGSTNLTLLYTQDGGTTWIDTTPGGLVTSFFTDLYFTDSQNGWTTSGTEIYSTKDGGASWKVDEFSSNIHSGIGINALTATSDSTAYAAGKVNTSATQSRATVYDNGNSGDGTWRTTGYFPLISGDVLRSIEFSDFDNGFAGGQKGVIYKMEYDGINFNGPWEQNFDIGFESWISSISFSSTTNGMFNTSTEINSQTVALIYHTYDGGETWSAQPDSIPGLQSAKLCSPNYKYTWIVGSGGAIYKGVSDATNPPTSVSTIERLSLSVAPNPFRDRITIQLPDSYENVQVKVIGITGQVHTAINLEGFQNQIHISNLEVLPSGMYFLNVSSSNKTVFVTKKLIKR